MFGSLLALSVTCLLLAATSVSMNFLPMTSPVMDVIVFITSQPSRSIVDVTLTQCAMGCLGSDFESCTCFNYNVTTNNCSLFNGQNHLLFDVDKTGSTWAYQASFYSVEIFHLPL
jgi:hypothetical protein